MNRLERLVLIGVRPVPLPTPMSEFGRLPHDAIGRTVPARHSSFRRLNGGYSDATLLFALVLTGVPLGWGMVSAID